MLPAKQTPVARSRAEGRQSSSCRRQHSQTAVFQGQRILRGGRILKNFTEERKQGFVRAAAQAALRRRVQQAERAALEQWRTHAAARARSLWRSTSCQLLLARLPTTATAPSDTVAERLGFAQTSFVPCWRVRCHPFLRFSTFIVFRRCDCRGGGGCSRADCRSLTASRSSFDCLASSTGAGTRESAHSQSNWCALNVCCRRGSAGSAHRCGPGRPTRQHLQYCSAADASMVDRHCEANNPASYASVVTVAVVWGASLALSLMPVRFPRLGQMPSGSPSSPTSAMEAGSRHMVESGVDRTQTDAFCFSSSRAVLQPSSAHRRPAPNV